MKFLNARLKDQRGQGVMEYVIISSLIGIVCLTVVKQFGETVKVRVEHMTKAVQKIE